MGYGGERGIRTLGGLAPTTVFETAPFNHSGTSPGAYRQTSEEGGCICPDLLRLIYPICRPDATERVQKGVPSPWSREEVTGLPARAGF